MEEIDNELYNGFLSWESEENVHNEVFFNYIIEQISAIVLYNKNDLEELLIRHFPKSHSFAKDMVEIINHKDNLTPSSVGRIITSLYKKADDIRTKLNLPPLLLTRNIAINPVLSVRQLDLMMEQVFTIKKYADHDIYYLELNATGQNSMFLGLSDTQNIKAMTVSQFYDFKKIRCLIKQ